MVHKVGVAGICTIFYFCPKVYICITYPSQMKWVLRILPLLLLALLLLHIPFLEADPDSNISFSRGPFTDEGLNSIQLRNLIDHGYLDLDECDNLLKTPAFNAVLALPYLIFGTDLITGRATVMLVALVLVWLFSQIRGLRIVAGIFILVGMTQYYVFQFTHFALAEIISSLLILLSIGLYFSGRISVLAKSRGYMLVLSAIVLSLAYYMKIQFIYIVVLPFVALMLEMLLTWSKGQRGLVFRALAIGILIPLLLYFMAWYLPNASTYNYMMEHQSGTFGISSGTFTILRFNIEQFFLQGPSLVLSLLFPATVIVGSVILRIGPSERLRILFPAALAWNLLEFHKLLMVYLPTRYQLSLIVSMAFTVSLVLAELFENRRSFSRPAARIAATFAVLVILLTFAFNMIRYSDSHQYRTYRIREVNDYLAVHAEKSDVIIGAWAPTVTWKCNARAFPVWDGFLNYKDPINNFRPRAVISEPDEEDSNQAYADQGIDLYARSDSVRSFRIGLWKVSVFWINPSVE